MNESHVFESWGAFLDYVNQPPAKGAACESERIRSSDEWDLGLGWKGALKAASEGWDGPRVDVDRFASHVEDSLSTDRLVTTFEARYEVSGGEVDMGRFLAGEPECMIEATPITISRHGRAVRLVVTGGCTQGFDARMIRNRGAAIVALCDLLAKAQHPVEIWVGWRSEIQYGKHHVQHAVKVQDANEALDINRLLFAIAHPATHRRLAFRARERMDNRVAREACVGTEHRPGTYGRTSDLDASVLPDEAENTIYLGKIDQHENWTEAYALAWIQEQIDRIFG